MRIQLQALQASNREGDQRDGDGAASRTRNLSAARPTGVLFFWKTQRALGGANIDLLVEYAAGLNPWTGGMGAKIGSAPHLRGNLSIAGDAQPICRSSGFIGAPRIPGYIDYHDQKWFGVLSKQHVGLIPRIGDYGASNPLISEYVPRIAAEFPRPLHTSWTGPHRFIGGAKPSVTCALYGHFHKRAIFG